MGNICRQPIVNDDVPIEPQIQYIRDTSQQFTQSNTIIPRGHILSLNYLESASEDHNSIRFRSQSNKKHQKKQKHTTHSNFRPAQRKFLDPWDDKNYLSQDDNDENVITKGRSAIDLRFKRELILSVQEYRRSLEEIHQ